MHIFVTGPTGFIGSYFVREAMAAGHKITALQHKDTSAPLIPWPNQPTWLQEPLLSLRAEQLKDIDAIAHFAAVGVSPRLASWDQLETINVRGTLHLCKLAKEISARISVSGSFAEYGLSGNRHTYIPSNAPLEPTYPYAASKAAASILATSYARSEGIELAYLRIFNAFGMGQFDGNLWPSMRNAALHGEDFPLTKGEQIRDFVDVETVAHWFLRSVVTPSIKPYDPLIANVGSGNPQSIHDFCTQCWSDWGAEGKLLFGSIPYRDGEVMRFVPEIDYSELSA